MSIAIIGSGAFGTALAICLAQDGSDITLWGRSAAKVADMQARRVNPLLPTCPIPESVHLTSDLSALNASTYLLAVPAQSLAGALRGMQQQLDGKTLVSCAKGISVETGEGPSAMIAQICPNSPIAVLTGPSFADEIASGKPTALTLAASDASLRAQLQKALARKTMRLYTSPDPIGAELGGALKNVIALAAGICVGAELGESARAAVIARGFAEMQRVTKAFGGEPETLSGLSGLGDLVLTARSEKSRNTRAGILLGRGEIVPDDLTVEGIATSIAIVGLAEQQGLHIPLMRAVAEVVSNQKTAQDAIEDLLSRPLTQELSGQMTA